MPQGGSFGILNVVLYCAAMALLCLIAIGTFFGEGKGNRSSGDGEEGEEDAACSGSAGGSGV